MKDAAFKNCAESIPDLPFDFAPTHGFKSSYPFANNGFLNAELGQGNRHLISTVLAVTRNYGNNEVEALRQLKTTMLADETNPKGTFYFSETTNVRSRTRTPNHKVAMETLERMGHKAKVITTAVPSQVDDVAGLTCGANLFKWEDSKILPGAICENLTSYGGIFWRKPGQTTIAEFVRNNVAGSSGTVTEPYACLLYTSDAADE